MKNTINNVDTLFLQKTITLAEENVLSGKGGPFAAIITMNDVIIATGTNIVTTINDPTAHAEISAIREACRVLDDYKLEGCTLYSSCEPCPMCLGAIYWARLKRLVFAAGKHQAKNAGFDDAFIYKEIKLSNSRRHLETIQIKIHEDKSPFELWARSTIKQKY